MVECLNCGRREQAQASAPDERLTFLCEDCRIELKRSPQAIPGYDTVKLLGRGGMGCVMLGARATNRPRRRDQNFASGICRQRESDETLHARDRRRRGVEASRTSSSSSIAAHTTAWSISSLNSSTVLTLRSSLKLAAVVFVRRRHLDHFAGARRALVRTRAGLHSSRLQRPEHPRLPVTRQTSSRS